MAHRQAGPDTALVGSPQVIEHVVQVKMGAVKKSGLCLTYFFSKQGLLKARGAQPRISQVDISYLFGCRVPHPVQQLKAMGAGLLKPCCMP